MTKFIKTARSQSRVQNRQASVLPLASLGLAAVAGFIMLSALPAHGNQDKRHLCDPTRPAGDTKGQFCRI
jgi:hypothetical protein